MSSQDLTYSQSSLQDFEECPRRFQLRYVDRRVWPAVQAEPLVEHERHLERGVRFHRLVERHQLGLPEQVLSASIDDSQLMVWWRSYLEFAASHLGDGERYPEFVLSADVGTARVVAKYDLLVVQPGERVVIYDWKTYPHSPSREWFSKRAQTQVYPVVLLTSKRFPWLEPSQVVLTYWVAGSAFPVEFVYDDQAFARDRRYVEQCIERIERLAGFSEWPLTQDERACRFCVYRSLCGRGVSASLLGEEQETDLLDVGVGDVWDVLVGLDVVDGVGF